MRSIGVGVAIVLSAAALITSLANRSPRVRGLVTRTANPIDLDLPNNEDIESIHITFFTDQYFPTHPKLYPKGDRPQTRKKIEDFAVPRDGIPQVMRWFRPPHFSEDPYFAGEHFGDISIKPLSRDPAITLKLFWTGGALGFTQDGEHYFKGNFWAGLDGAYGMWLTVQELYTREHGPPAPEEESGSRELSDEPRSSLPPVRNGEAK